METEAQLVDRAIGELPLRNIFSHGGVEYHVRALRPVSAWQPAILCMQDHSQLIGEDSCGNFFLRAPDGSVRFWDHETEDVGIIASSMHIFLTSLSAPVSVKLKPGQVKKVWIDPAFLEEQKRKKNA